MRVASYFVVKSSCNVQNQVQDAKQRQRKAVLNKTRVIITAKIDEMLRGSNEWIVVYRRAIDTNFLCRDRKTGNDLEPKQLETAAARFCSILLKIVGRTEEAKDQNTKPNLNQKFP